MLCKKKETKDIKKKQEYDVQKYGSVRTAAGANKKNLKRSRRRAVRTRAAIRSEEILHRKEGRGTNLLLAKFLWCKVPMVFNVSPGSKLQRLSPVKLACVMKGYVCTYS